MTCTFFGHRDATHSIKAELIKTLTDLIENKKVKLFYVGNSGNFDGIVFETLKDLSKYYPDRDK